MNSNYTHRKGQEEDESFHRHFPEFFTSPLPCPSAALIGEWERGRVGDEEREWQSERVKGRARRRGIEAEKL
jgi:hypothetical protein